MSVSKKVRESGLILGALGVIGFIGIVWLMIYGNLSGNLGFPPQSELYVNATGGFLNQTTYTIPQATDSNFLSWTVSEVFNSSDTENNLQILLNTSEYTVTSATGIIVNGSNTIYPLVNITYTTSITSTGEVNTEAVIGNVTGGFGTFFGFSNTFFTIAAIVLLIFMLVGLLAIVMQIAKGRKKSSSGYSGY